MAQEKHKLCNAKPRHMAQNVPELMVATKRVAWSASGL